MFCLSFFLKKFYHCGECSTRKEEWNTFMCLCVAFFVLLLHLTMWEKVTTAPPWKCSKNVPYHVMSCGDSTLADDFSTPPPENTLQNLIFLTDDCLKTSSVESTASPKTALSTPTDAAVAECYKSSSSFSLSTLSTHQYWEYYLPKHHKYRIWVLFLEKKTTLVHDFLSWSLLLFPSKATTRWRMIPRLFFRLERDV